MEVDELLHQARKMWGKERVELDHITIALGVVYGDICRQARAQKEGKMVDDQEVKKEMGNLLFSLIRWCDDLGYDPKECIELAKAAQQRYVVKRQSTS